MSFNIRHGRGMDGRVDIERLASFISELAPDIACLQEVDKEVERSGRIDTMAQLAQRTGMQALFGWNLDYQRGGYGNGLLTRLPILSHANHHYQMLRSGEQRGVLMAELSWGERPIWVFNTHVDYRPDSTERLMNVGDLEHLAEQRRPEPVIVCGDFNCLPESTTHQAMKRKFDDLWERAGQDEGWTFPADAPNRRIDYIFRYRPTGSGLIPVRASTAPTDTSDHWPVIVECAIDF